MDWKDLLGSNYVDGMTDEEAKAKFDEMYIPRSEHEKDAAKKKQLIDDYSSQLAEAKRKQRENMSAAERAKLEAEEYNRERDGKIQSLERELKIRDYKEQYVAMGYDAELALETAKAQADGDIELVMSNSKIFNDRRTAQLRTEWEQEYQINPPAGNGSGKVDYSKQIQEAQDRGDMVAMASLIRQQAEANK